MKPIGYLFITAALAVVIIGCSGTGESPLTPRENLNRVGDIGKSAGCRDLWGLYEVRIDPVNLQVEVTPLRHAAFTANVNKLLESKPGNLIISDLDVSNFQTEGRLDCTVTLKHPLPGLDRYDGFDVWGVFMHNGASALNYDGLTWSGGPNAGTDEAVLLNPDGYTRWFNQTEFDGSGAPILEFWPGKLSNLENSTAVLNGYKIFADGLGTEDDYYSWITSPGNADNRGIFRAGAANSRRYRLKFPMPGGSPQMLFQYAVIATWEPGDPTLTGDPSAYDPFDFPTSANCEEPFLVHVSTVGSDLYYAAPDDFGGNFRADIEVFDWQGGSVGGLGVPNEVNRVILEGDFLPGGTFEFSQAELAMVAIPSTENSSVFQVDIPNCTPASAGETSFWLIVESSGLNGASYYQGFPTEYPDPARRAAFQRGSVTVGGESPHNVIYVDDSNTSGIEDGTMAHPYNTIQEGVDAAASMVLVWVWVDDSGNPYEEQVNMKDGTLLRSVNWDESDGTNRAFIDGPEDPETYSVRFYNVSGAILRGFRIGFAGPWALEWPYYDCTKMIGIEGGANITVTDCLFTGQTDMETVYPIVVSGAANVTIANCRMASIDRGANEFGCDYFRGVYADSCPDLCVRNCVFADIRPTEDASSKGFELCYITGSADVVVENNLIHHAAPLAGVGDLGAILLEGFSFRTCTNPTVINNTVDSMDVTHAFSIQQVFAYRFDDCPSVTFKNNIATRLYCNGFPPPLARGVIGINSTFVCSFCDIWDIGPGSNGALYWGGATPGTGAISADPLYIDPDNEQYDVSSVSPARWGDPSFVDWDDSGAPSNDPDNYDPDTRSRMGCHGGPEGEFVGLLTP